MTKELTGVLLVTTKVRYSCESPEALQALIKRDLAHGLHIDVVGANIDFGAYSLLTVGGAGVQELPKSEPKRRHKRKRV